MENHEEIIEEENNQNEIHDEIISIKIEGRERENRDEIISIKLGGGQGEAEAEENNQKENEIISIKIGGGEERAEENYQTSIRKKEFKQFDIIFTADNDDNNESISDHHFYASSSTDKYSNGTIKKIMQEWNILKESLPVDSIYVRAYEGRIDLLRAVIIGAAGTPYHDGLFFFDIQFPSNYPNQPPNVYYHSFGFKLNPNLYRNGEICLSLLNTWYGIGKEKWNPSESTVLQVLVSIQSLVLNAKPIFNESTDLGIPTYLDLNENQSLAFNQRMFALSCLTMLSALKSPPKHFEEFVAQHFRERAETILIACKAYVHGGVKVGDHPIEKTQSTSFSSAAATDDLVFKRFWDAMEIIYPKLVKEFIKNGSSLVNYGGDNGVSDSSSKNLFLLLSDPPRKSCFDSWFCIIFFVICYLLALIIPLVILKLRS